MSDKPIKYITKVEIQGLFGRYDIEWNLHPDVNVLAGINGSGKTTILNAINATVILGETEYFKSNKMIIKVIFNNDAFSSVKNGTLEFRPNLGATRVSMDLIRTFDAKAKPKELLEKADNEVKTELDFELWKLQKE
ncbi:MAG: hypothetical protein RL637_83, partial [Pseudomonadota bacterium]